MRSTVGILGVSLFATVAAAAPDTLVVKQGDKFAPGAAASWSEASDVVVFTLAAGVKAADVATTLQGSLTGATVTVVDGKIKVAGFAPKVLLERLSSLSLSGGGADPLAALAGLGPGASNESPEAGGSIRASKPTAGSVRPRLIQEHSPDERVSAEVVKVDRGAFPEVHLTVKLRTTPKSGALRDQLKKNKLVFAAVILSGDGTMDFSLPATQRNIGAYYLTKGDKVIVHPVAAEGGVIEIDFVEREK